MKFLLEELLFLEKELNIYLIYSYNNIFLKTIISQIKNIEMKFNNIESYGININLIPSIIGKFNIASVPSIFILDENKKVLKKNLQFSSQEVLEKIINDIVNKRCKNV